ncbi:PH domain-containing protein [Rhizomonospora bruguierae]|uniref:PH domain-containing protein n=1 Tax=Rhizomonospora bruguierae TaxID=1581705 RepID=UPI001BD10D93|nr:PH domain-containing protein [Micromonospora sp. NBRC 107566]
MSAPDPSPRTPTHGLRFRPHGALAVAALVAALGGLPLISTAWYTAPVLLVPLAVVVWVLRSGTVADATGLRVRALLGERFVPWTEVEELAVERRRRVVAVLHGHRSVWLSAVRPAHLPAIIAVAGGTPPPAPPSPEQPPPAQTPPAHTPPAQTPSVAVDHPVD